MRALLLAAAGALAAAALPAQAAPAIAATSAWSRPAAAGTTGVGYLTLTNAGKAPDALVSVESPLARKVEIHTSSMAGGVMRMTPEAETPIPAGGQAVFAPGGRHLMLLGLTRALKTGDKAPATLHFRSGATLRVEFVVSPTGPAKAAAPMEHMQMH